MRQLPGWSFMLTDGSSPDSLAAVHAELPEPLRTKFLEAVTDKETHWVEKSDLYKVASLYVFGGVAVDALDQKLVSAARLEEVRSISPLLVVGNCPGALGGGVEPDTIGCVKHDSRLLSLLELIVGN